MGGVLSVAVHQVGVDARRRNLFMWTTFDDFTSGTYTSAVVETRPFEYMVLSWNADTPDGTHIEIDGRVRVGGRWSSWLSWGKWSTSAFLDGDGRLALPGSAPAAETDDPLAKLATDELQVKGAAGEAADAFQYRLTLHSLQGGASDGGPRVRLVACTLRNTLPGRDIPKEYPPDAPDLSHLEVDLDVPAYSQYRRDPRIGGSICSPTCMAMVLAYRGIDISPEQAAWGVNDYTVPMFGNWPFNTAFAASYGLVAYVEYLTPAAGSDPWYAVKQEVVRGNPVVVSVRYRRPDYSGSSSFPVEGVPINATGGHLVLVRGFAWRDGVEYVIVNDPAAPDDETVRREYRADQFAVAWHKKVAYITRMRGAGTRNPTPPRVLDGTLVPIGGVAEGFVRYQLQVDGESIDLSDANLRSIVVSLNGARTTPVSLRAAGEKGAEYLWFDTLSAHGKHTFSFMDKFKRVYRASIDWKPDGASPQA